MVRKLLGGAALAAALVLVLNTGVLGADNYYTGGGGGGGGGGGVFGGAGGKGGGAMYHVDNGDRSDIGGTGGQANSIGDTANGGDGGRGAGQGHRDEGLPAADRNGGQGSGGQYMTIGPNHGYFNLNLDLLDTYSGETLYVFGGSGGEGGEGTGNSGENGGSGGNGGYVNIGVYSHDPVNFNITVAGGNGGDGGQNTVGGTGVSADDRNGRGGHGGDVLMTSGQFMRVTGSTITVAGGNAGNAYANTGRNGGRGGDVVFNATTIRLENAAIHVNNGAGTTTTGQLNSSNPVAPVGGNTTVSIQQLVAGSGGGSLSTANGVMNNNNGMGDRHISIGSIDARDGDMSLDFTGIANFYGDSATFGNVSVGENRTFDVAVGVRGTNYNWTGNLTTFNNVTINGLDASGKSITSVIDDIYDFTVGSIISGDMIVDDATSVTLNVNKDNAKAVALEDPTTSITIFGSGITGKEALQDESFNIVSGGYRGTGVFAANGMSVAGSIVMSLSEDAYNALLAAPALMSLVNGGADAVERAAGSFSPMALIGGNVGTQFGVFASMGAASMDVDTGSGIESDSFHLLVGPGLRINSGTGRTDIGAFFEAGWGSFDTFNSVYRGEGDSEYYGGGLLLRHDTCFGLYAEASVRFGTADAEYVRRDINTDYDLDSSYVGGHLGLGYIFRPSDASSFDVFAKGLWTRVNDDSAVDDAGYTIDVDSTDSFRTQLGAKFSYNFCDQASFYVKGVWEHEFDGETAGRYDGVAIVGKADSSGSSVIGELGVDWRLAERVSVGASVYGVAGQREGFGGNLSIGIGF